MKKTMFNIIAAILFTVGCTDRDTTVDKSTLLGDDYRLFQNTPAWELAKSVEDGDLVKIKELVSRNKRLINFREPRFGQPLLSLAVKNINYNAAKILLELGANPNMQDLNHGDSPLMQATKIVVGGGRSDPKFLELLLKFGGDPNESQHGPGTTRDTPLMDACASGYLDYVKILVSAGANVNAINEYGDSPLATATIQEHIDIVLFLIEKGADFKRVLYQTVPEKENRYITDALRYFRFDLGSEEYKKKMQLVDFLKKNGMDYRKTAIPQEFFKDYSKEYLDKY